MKLYEIKQGEETIYGHKLATNSQGQWVMEIKGSGDVLAVDKSLVQEVLPYTISVSYGKTDKNYAYLAEAGQYKVGDVFVIDAPYGRAIVNVVAIDTKSPQATTVFHPLAQLSTVG